MKNIKSQKTLIDKLKDHLTKEKVLTKSQIEEVVVEISNYNSAMLYEASNKIESDIKSKALYSGLQDVLRSEGIDRLNDKILTSQNRLIEITLIKENEELLEKVSSLESDLELLKKLKTF